MSWLQKLYRTYDACEDAPQFASRRPLPVSYTEQQAHVEIIVDAAGDFVRAGFVPREVTAFPATEDSAGRTSKPAPHPLCDKAQYCAADYKSFGGAKETFFDEYIQQLRHWQRSEPDAKAGAVLRYVEKGTVVADLIRAGVFVCGPDGKLLTEWNSQSAPPEIFKLLTPKEGKRDQGDAFLRWRVQVPGDPLSATWEDPGVRDSWVRFEASRNKRRGLCMVTGEIAALAVNHPKRLRNPGDKAKLISANDESGYTFKGRFTVAEQVCGVGSVVSQKAHNALRWLIERQGYRAGDQAFVAWAVSGKPIPDPLADTASLFGVVKADVAAGQEMSYGGDAGQHFALRLKRAIGGYRANLDEADEIVVLGLDSATPGRMAITYYRELTGSEFLGRVGRWHEQCSWPQHYSEDKRFAGAPAPRDIAEAAYGLRVDEKLRKATVERLLPCIIDARPLPGDIVSSSVRRVCNRAGMKRWEWEKCLGIACALFRYSRKNEEDYEMSLEENRTTRDYLYGRLLAIAENIEQRALRVAGESRDSNAAKLMQRFANHPYATWRNIEIALAPYKARLRATRPSVLLDRDKLLDSVMGMFSREEFVSDGKLSGEFLLGYHCQRAALWSGRSQAGIASDEGHTKTEGEKANEQPAE